MYTRTSSSPSSMPWSQAYVFIHLPGPCTLEADTGGKHLRAGEGPRPEAAALPGILQAGREHDHDGAILRSHSDPVLLNLQGMRDQCQACHYPIPSYNLLQALGQQASCTLGPIQKVPMDPTSHRKCGNHLHEQHMLKIAPELTIIQRRPQAN